MNIKITDNFGLATALDIRDDCAFARAKLTQLGARDKQLYAEFDQPVDQAILKDVTLTATATSPDLLSKCLPTLVLSAGVNSALSIKTHADGSLCGSSPFALPVPIAANEAWVGIELDVTAKASASLTENAVGICLQADSKLSSATYTLVSGAPLPLLRQACAQAFSNFSITSSPDDIRKQPVGTLNQTEVSGSILAKVTLSLPCSVNALGSANLPFNTSLEVQPSVTVQVGGSIKLLGDFLFRSWKKADNLIHIGIYKKHGSTLTATFTASAALEGEADGTDFLSQLLNKALPGIDTKAAGISGDNAKTLDATIKAGVDGSLGAQLNATCSAAFTDEAAIVYELPLNAGDPAHTDAALQLALEGDWTALAALPNATRIRDIVVETVEKKSSLSLNLFGLYNATSVTDYVRRSTVLLDESGQLSIVDKADASRISAQSDPRASDTQKLRKALMQDFLCTATYAVVGGKLGLKLAVVQSYLDYQRQMSRADMFQNIQLGYELGLIPAHSLDPLVIPAPSFAHASITATVSYDMPALMSIFFRDPAARTPRTRDELESVGRNTMSDFLDPDDPTYKARKGVLESVQAYADMDNAASMSAIERLEWLQGFSPPEVHAVEGDWVSIRWWSGAVSKVAPALQATLAAIASVSGDPTNDSNFEKQRAHLAQVLGDVTRNTDAAFVHGWGEAVMFALSGRTGKASMDLAFNGITRHFGTAAS